MDTTIKNIADSVTIKYFSFYERCAVLGEHKLNLGCWKYVHLDTIGM